MSILLPRRSKRVLFYLAAFVVLLGIFKLVFLPYILYTDGPVVFELVAEKGNQIFMKRRNISTEKPTPHSNKKHVVTLNKFGKLNVHIWYEICGESLESFKNHALFPKLPSSRIYADLVSPEQRKVKTNYGERIFGFMHVKKSGLYSFRVKGFSIEVWVSADGSPFNSKLQLKKEFPGKSKLSLASEVFELSLSANKEYYIEILHKVAELAMVFDLRWKVPGSSQYVPLRDSDISLMFEDGHLNYGQIDLDFKISEILPIHRKAQFPKYDAVERPRANLHQLPLFENDLLQTVLPKCLYEPSYLVKSVLRGYKGVWETHYTSIYPIDKSNVTRFGLMSLGNDELERRKATAVVEQFMEAINKVIPRKFKLKKILSVEENHDEIKGDRYLLELELQEMNNGLPSEKSVRVSKYVYRQKRGESLCTPEGYQWKRNSTVNIVLTVGGRQGRWVQHFINNIAEIYHETKDENLNVVIMDFNSKDIDIESSLKESGLPRYMLLHSNSKFHKTIGLQTAMEYVTNPNDIVFVCDLHLYLPVTIVDHIRKHCIQGKSVFSPLLRRLDCGDTPNNPVGRWEADGYGPMATFKSDWNRFGGMNVEAFRHKWGGEDWEMVSRILSAGYEVERLKILNFVHYFHTKKGMWHEAM